jgi:eukaryotic-like serine/threonine-protein kinase
VSRAGSTGLGEETLVSGDVPDKGGVPARLVGRYSVGDLLGRGGSGQVHRAWDELAGEAVAIKFVSGYASSTARLVRRELTALRLLDLPGVVRLRDDGEDQGQHFLVMDLLTGGRFDTLADRGAWEGWAAEAYALLEALARVHFAGVLHRDLKPGNVLLDSQGRPVITDFGLAQGREVERSGTGPAEGTPRYMAPEQRRGEACDERTDLFALGVMFADMLDAGPAPDHVRRVVDAM